MNVIETNKIPLKEKNVKLRIALVYPNNYKNGMSSYTIHFLYSLFNRFDNVRCERFFLPDHTKLPAFQLKDKRIGFDAKLAKSVDSGSSLSSFDIIAFTVQFEMDYLNILWFLDTIGIPLFVHERAKYSDKQFPLIIGGGPCIHSNPLTLLPFLDILCIGDIEPIVNDFIDFLISNRELLPDFNSKLERGEFNSLKPLLFMPNLLVSYITLIYLFHTNDEKFNSIKELNLFPIKKVYQADLLNSNPPEIQIIPRFKDSKEELAFGESFLIELNRGCPYSCYFCMTGALHKPLRNRELSDLKNIVNIAKNNNPIKKITFIGSAIADHPHFFEICKYIYEQNLQLMIPSIRIEKITDDILDILKRLDVKTITIAPETGSDKLRILLNKKVTNKTIIEKCIKIFASGFETIKFYFIVGLPHEEKSDVNAIPALIKEIINQSNLKNLKNKIRVSINYFIPKLMTPFGNYTHNYLSNNQNHLKTIGKKLEDSFKEMPMIDLELMNIKESYVQTILSLIDETFGKFLYDFYLQGGKWNAIPRISEENGVDLDEFLTQINNCFLNKSQSLPMKKLKSIIE